MRKTLVLVLPLVLLGSPAWGGAVFLAGHDADDHGAEAVYSGLYDTLRSNVTNGGDGILSIGANPISDAGFWIQTVASFMAVPQPVTFITQGEILSTSFDGFAILHIPSDSGDTFGGITPGENAMLTSRAADVGAFVNSGGGLFALTQGQLPDAYGWLGPVGAISTLSVGPMGDLPSGADFDDVTPTPEGAALGIDDSNLDGCCWHNVFTAFPAFLTVLAVANEPQDPAFDGVPCVLGGTQVIVAATCIDIKPGSDPNAINPRNKGVIPVAAMGTSGFDVTTIDPVTVRFGPDDASPAHRVMIHFSDVNEDGIMDAVFHFRTQQTGIQHGDTEACMSWTTFAGVSGSCCDDVMTVPRWKSLSPLERRDEQVVSPATTGSRRVVEPRRPRTPRRFHRLMRWGAAPGHLAR